MDILNKLLFEVLQGNGIKPFTVISSIQYYLDELGLDPEVVNSTKSNIMQRFTEGSGLTIKGFIELIIITQYERTVGDTVFYIEFKGKQYSSTIPNGLITRDEYKDLGRVFLYPIYQLINTVYRVDKKKENFLIKNYVETHEGVSTSSLRIKYDENNVTEKDSLTLVKLLRYISVLNVTKKVVIGIKINNETYTVPVTL